MKWIPIVLLFSFAFMAWGAETQPEKAPSGEFELDSRLLDTLYRESASEATVTAGSSLTSLQLTPQLSMVSPSAFELSNKYFDVSYTDYMKSLPVFHLGLSTPLVRLGNLSISGMGRVGYTYREGLYQVQSKVSGARTDLIKLHWIPLSVEARLEYSFPGAAFIKPCVGIGSGTQWLYQTGRLDGIEQGFWIPFYTLSPGFTLFDQEGVRDWFGGITFSGTYQSSFSSEQLIRGWSIDLGLNVFL